MSHRQMSDLKKYITKRKKADKEFAEGYDEDFENFKFGVMLRQQRLTLKKKYIGKSRTK